MAIDRKIILAGLRVQEAGHLLGELKKKLGFVIEDCTGTQLQAACVYPTEPECVE
jgi:hypothetical protein